LAFLFEEGLEVLLFDDGKRFIFGVALFLAVLLVLKAKVDDVLWRG